MVYPLQRREGTASRWWNVGEAATFDRAVSRNSSAWTEKEHLLKPKFTRGDEFPTGKNAQQIDNENKNTPAGGLNPAVGCSVRSEEPCLHGLVRLVVAVKLNLAKYFEGRNMQWLRTDTNRGITTQQRPGDEHS